MNQEQFPTEVNKHLQQLQEKYDKFRNAPKYNTNQEEVFCLCRKIDDGELMVACDGCDEWYHFRCVGMNTNLKELVNNYYCPFCDELLHKGKTVWKKKCRLDGCFNPIKIDKETGKGSKYCSPEHGVEFMKSQLLKHFVESNNEMKLQEGQVVKIIQQTKDYAHFKSLGTELPIFDKSSPKGKEECDFKITKLEAQVTSMNTTKELYLSKTKYLLKLKEKIKLLNEILSTDHESENGAVEKTETKPTKSRKSKKKKKTKRNKIDICGFDSNLRWHTMKWKAFTETDEYKQFMKFDGSFEGVTNDQIREQYKNLKNESNGDQDGDTEMTDNDLGPPVFGSLCIHDKKKCTRHLTWYGIIEDDLETKVSEIEAKTTEDLAKKDKIYTDFTIRNWEIWESEN
ncbi:unnamed protein product [Ambrosiozyma monospora]|uniref:Unnamed protein product n=1 Tax=Ambrosiozyma monospora TaxID=43982 RepID=A0A9W7DFJ0_AMBMO|nr:unnamed protein product [Ambrosiozyma monospora]